MKKAFFAMIALSLALNGIAQKISAKKAGDQEEMAALKDSIAILAHLAVEDSVADVRISSSKRLEVLLKTALSRPGSFDDPFEQAENISIVSAPDRSFRIFTWQLFEDSAHYQYRGFIQTGGGKSVVYALKDAGKTIQSPEKQFLTPEKWYGCLYYNIKPFKSKNGARYLLFGYNSNDGVEKIKVCDVLSLQNGRPSFGAPVFSTGEKGNTKTMNRLIVRYAAESTARLNYDEELGLIVADHLEAVKSSNPEAASYVLAPDGTYEAYKLEKGEWRHIDMLPTTPMDQAPRPVPLDGKKGKITGNRQDVQKFNWPDEVKKKQ